MTAPTFFVLGAPKCGTTALYHYLVQHPQICMSSPKEPRCLELADAADLPDCYQQAFRHYRGQPAAGEASATSLFVPYVPRRLKQNYPQARFVIVLRDPVARAFSDWWMYYSSGIERLSFPDAIDENLRRLDRGERFDGRDGEPRWKENVHGITQQRRIPCRTYVDVGYYGEQLQRYFDLFPREQFCLLRSDELRRDTAGVMTTVFRFLGVDADVPLIDEDSQNEAQGAVSAPVLRMFRLAQTMRLPRLLPHAVNDRLRRAFGRRGARPQIDAATKARLTTHFEEDAHKLETLLGTTFHRTKAA